MKPLSELIHRISWAGLVFGGLIVVVALALFVTPYHIIDYRNDDASPAERQAIKREVDNAFADNAIEIARGVLKGMQKNTSDPKRREELDEALQSLDEARTELREAGIEALRAKREAARDARQAVKEAAQAIKEAQKQAERALREAGVESEAVRNSLDEALAAAKKAQEDAQAAAEEAAKAAEEDIHKQARIVEENGKRRIEISAGTGKPMLNIEIDATGNVPAPPAPPVPGANGAPPMPPMPAMVLPPELKSEIRRNVTHDLYRIGVGAGLILVFIPLFILTIIAKFFIDRSRAALRLADLKRKEAEYSRMSQQVTEAKLSALQAQVEPHFLYNTLASVQALTEVDPSRANAMTGHLIQYLRNALPKMRESVSTVGQEVELVRAYLNILQMRMGKRLAFTIEVPPELNELPFPPLMLPSLVENAIKHGLEPQREGGEVRIRAEADGETLRMIVADTGRGFSDNPGAGVGLANIRERLAAMYGAEARLRMEANTPQGVVATIEVPRRGATAGAGNVNTAFAGTTPAEPPPVGPRTKWQRFLSGMGVAERVWRKGLSFTFVGLVVVAAIVAALAVAALLSGALPVQIGNETLHGPGSALIGTAGIAIGFLAVVMALAIVLAVVYGLGFLAVGLVIFIPIMVLVGVFPALAPFILVGLGIWWFVRRGRRKEAEARRAAEAARQEPSIEAPPSQGPPA